MDRDLELENVNAAFILESRIYNLKKNKEELLRNRPQQPIKPNYPKLGKPIYPDIPDPIYNVHYKKTTWQYFIAAICFIGLLILIFIGDRLPLEPIYEKIAEITNEDIYSAEVFFKTQLTMVLLGFGIVMIFIGKLANRQKKKQAVQKYKNTVAYLNQERTIEYLRKQNEQYFNQQAVSEYEQKIAYYNQILLPAYNKQSTNFAQELMPAWIDEVESIDCAISTNELALDEVYDLNIIPGKYRNIEAITFISSFMGTSNYDLKFAIERFDKEVDQIIGRMQISLMEAQLLIMQQILTEVQYANYLNEQILNEAQNSNKILSSIRNWTAANTAMHAYDICHQRRLEKEANANK